MNFNGINTEVLDSLPKKARVLDYGCGNGEVSRFLATCGFEVFAADVNPRCEEYLQEGLSIKGIAQIKFVPILEIKDFLIGYYGEFDCIICREVLEHVPNHNSVIKLFGQLLKNEGTLILSVPTYLTERWFLFCDPEWLTKSDHLRIFGKKEITDLLSINRFVLDKQEGQSFRWSLFWLMLSPFRVRHVMGNPISHTKLVQVALRISNLICQIPIIERFGNRLLPKSSFYYTRKRKPRVLIVYDYIDWILGSWAKNIMALHGEHFDIVAISMFHAMKDKKYTAKLVKKFDIIHLLLPHPYDFFRELAPSHTFITTMHHWVDWTNEYRRAVFESQLIITPSVEWKQKLEEKGVSHELITVIHSGVKDDFFKTIQSELIPSSPKLTCGFFAKYDSNESDRKGTRHLLSLVKNIAISGAQDKIRIILSGPGWAMHVSDIQSSGIEIIYLNNVSEKEMPGLYQALDVYLMLSDIEGGPVTLAEAMASGCLVFSTLVGIAHEIIEDNSSGILIDTSKPDEIVRKLLHFQKNTDERIAICDNAQQFANKHMRFSCTMSGVNGIYQRALGLVESPGIDVLQLDKENIFTKKHAHKVIQ